MLTTIVELPEFQKRSEKALSKKEKDELFYFLSLNPTEGDLIKGTGGVRKLRWSSKNKGKRSGSRIIYFYYNEKIPLFLLTMFSKNQKIDLSSSEQKELAKLTKLLVANYSRKA